MSANHLLTAALDYAARGWPVFPVWWIQGGRCACGQADCEHPGKHPVGKLAPNGRNSATTDEKTIRGWWGVTPDANIGIATGPESRLVVVDVDPRNGGKDSREQMERLGSFPFTPTAYTGGDGEHILLKHPRNGQKIKSKSELGGFPGIDQKADGGYIVAPPSNHISGRQYSWRIGPDTPLAIIPDWLMTLLTGEDTHHQQSEGQGEEKIPRGKRNATLTSLAGSMRRRGLSQEAIVAALLIENKRCDPPLSESEVLAIAKSVGRYDPATGGSWPIPEPLRRAPEPGEPFPVEALGPILGEAATAMHLNIKAPMAVCGQSVLAAANLTVQGHADVGIDGRKFPLSEFFMSIAVSGDRKSAADRAALTGVDEHQKYLLEGYKADLAKHKLDDAIWKRDYEAALKKRDPKARRESVESLPPAPTAPPYPQLTTEEPTYEGLCKLLATGWPSVGIFSDEAGRFFGGHAMSQEHRLKTLAGLSNLWDGKPISRTRAGDGAMTLYGRRVCAHFLMQPMVSETILGDPLAHEQGFLSRCLTTFPESTLGEQQYEAQDLTRVAAYERCRSRLSEILKADLPLKVDPATGESTNELILRLLPLAQDAKVVWVRFHDWVQEHLRPDGIFRPISGIAAKAAEHALRLAGTLALVDDLNTPIISLDHMKNGITLAQFYLTEALRIFHSAKTNPDLLIAEKVLAWLRTREETDRNLVALPDVYQFGPNAVRDKATAMKVMQILSDHLWVKPVEGGTIVGGQKRRQVWEISPYVFQGLKI